MIFEKNIFLLWLQGWDKAPWLQRQVLESWIINNPDWNVILIDQNNLVNYVNDIDYIYDQNKIISPQAKSDIIRLSLLKNHGGVWADSTLLCMQPLDHWVFDAFKNSGIWMYHGHGTNFNIGCGHNISIREIANFISHDQVFMPPRKGEVKQNLANIEKSINVLGWKPKVSVEEWVKSQE